MIELLKMPKMKIKKKAGGTETITFQDGDEAGIQYRRKDTEDFRNGIDFSGDLPTIQKSGAAIEIRIISAGVTEAVKDDKGAYCFSSAEVLPSLNANADIYEAGTFLRPGIVKIVKIAKRAAAPEVTVDFANHSFKLKAGQEYAELTGGIKPFLDKDSGKGGQKS